MKMNTTMIAVAARQRRTFLDIRQLEDGTSDWMAAEAVTQAAIKRDHTAAYPEQGA